MTLADKKFPSSKAFDLINQALQDNETRTEMMKKANAIFAFDLTAPDGNTQKTWYIDLKEEGKVGQGDKKADCRLVLSDESFEQLINGSKSAQSLFMQGNLKIKGNVLLSLKLETVLKKIQNKAKL